MIAEQNLLLLKFDNAGQILPYRVNITQMRPSILLLLLLQLLSLLSRFSFSLYKGMLVLLSVLLSLKNKRKPLPM
jgi:hypothetical protein